MAGSQINLGINVTANTSQAKTEFANLQQSLTALIAQGSRMDIGTTTQVGLKKATQAAKELQIHMTQALNPKTGGLQLDKLNMSLRASGKTLTQYSKDLLQGGEAGQAAFVNLSKTITATQAPMARLSGAVGGLVKSFGTALKYQISYGAINAVTNSIRKAVTYAKELNSTLTDIRVVTGMTADQADRLAKNANKMAKELKSTTQEILKGQLIYLQQGNSVALAAKKAEITTKAANIAFNANQQQMSEYLTAIWNSYQVGSEELELFVDKIAAVGATTATSMEEMATAMTKVAATANTVGVTYDQLNATIATISSVTRTGSETVGTALKTIYARIGDLKIGGKDEDGLGLGQVSSQLKQAGVDILDANGNMRDMGLVVEEVGEKWQGWTRAQQTAVAQAIAGKRQYTQLMALFENWDQYTETLSTSENAEGELQKQQDIWAESWEAASNRVKSATEGMYNNLLNDDIMIDFTNALAYLVEAIDAITDGLGGIPGILAIVLQRFLAIKGVAIEETFANIGRTLMLTFKPGEALSQFEQVKMSFKEMQTSMNTMDLGVGMQNYINRLSDVNSLQVALTKSSNKLTSVQKMGFQTQIEVINQMYVSLEETACEIDRITQSLMNMSNNKISQSQMNSLLGWSGQTWAATEVLPDQKETKGIGKGGVTLLNSGDYKNYQTYYDKLAGSATNVDSVMKKLKVSLGETNPVFKMLSQGLNDADQKGKSLAIAMKILSNDSKALETILSLLGINLTDTDLDIDTLSASLQEARVHMENMENGSRRAGEAARKLGEDMDDAANKSKLGWSGAASAIMGISSAMMSVSSLVDTIKELGEENRSVEDNIKSVSSGLMSLSMIVMMLANTFKTAGKTMGWIGVAATLVIGLIEGIAAYIDSTTKTVEELNEEIEEVENNINSLQDEIQKLQEKQATASGIRSIELDGEIERLREIVRLEQQRQGLLEEEKEEKTREEIRKEAEKYENTSVTTGSTKVKVKSTASDSTSIENEVDLNAVKGLSDEQKQELLTGSDKFRYVMDPTGQTGGTLYYGTVGQEDFQTFEVRHSTTQQQAVANQTVVTDFVSDFRIAADKYTKDSSVDNDIAYRQAENEAITDLSNTFGKYASEISEDGEASRRAIITNLTAMKDVLPEGEQDEFLFSKLFTISPDSFTSLDKFKAQYGDLLSQLGYSKEDIDTYWKKFDLGTSSAALNARKFESTITGIKSSVTTASDAVKELDENSGKLSADTIYNLESAWSALGAQAKNYSDQLWINQGNQAKMKEIIQEATEATIAAQIAQGSFIGKTKEQIATELTAIGVKNADKVATEALSLSTARAKIETISLTSTEEELVTALATVAASSNTAKSAVYSLYIQERILNNADLDLSEKIKEILKVAAAAKTAGIEVAGLNSLLGLEDMEFEVDTGKNKWFSNETKKRTVKGLTGLSDMKDNETVYITKDQADKIGIEGRRTYTGIQIREAIQNRLSVAGNQNLAIDIEDIEWDVNSFSGGEDGKGESAADILKDKLSLLKYKWEEELITTQEYVNAIKEALDSGLLTEKEYLEQLREIWAAWDKQQERDKTRRETNIKARQDRGIYNWDDDFGDTYQNLKDARQRLSEYLALPEYEIDSDKLQKYRQDILDAEAAVENLAETYIKRSKEVADAAIAWGKMFGFEVGQNENTITKKMYEDQLKYLDDVYSRGEFEGSEKEYQEKRKAIIVDYANFKREKIKEAAEYELEQWKEIQEQKKAEIEAEKTITEGLHESLNSIREAQHEINKELQTSLTQYQYLDEETRKLLFNTDDYLELSKDLTSIQKQANKLAREYNNKILGKTEEEIEHITAEYERQNEMLMKQYEIKKAELEVEKKRLALNNVLNERNTQMFINGQWQWVADTKAIADAQQALLDAEYERDTATLEMQQQKAIDRLDSAIDDLDLEIARAEQAFEELCEIIDGDKNSLTQVLSDFGGTVDGLDAAIASTIENITGRDYDGNGKIGSAKNSHGTSGGRTLGLINGQTPSDAKVGDTIVTAGGSFLIVPHGTSGSTHNPTSGHSSIKLKNTSALGYLYSNATGTDNAFGGISRINEKGLELLATKYGGQFIELNPGDKVFNHDQFDFLYKFSKNPFSLLNGLSSSQSIDNSIRIGNFEITGNSEEGEALRSILTRILGNH